MTFPFINKRLNLILGNCLLPPPFLPFIQRRPLCFPPSVQNQTIKYHYYRLNLFLFNLTSSSFFLLRFFSRSSTNKASASESQRKKVTWARPGRLAG